ncbi:hypothetical protein IRJ41_005537 [Triplophysa rosa]|uniref:Uncharacterized protein n=1 Tax=Triplophysa rosa TaxID=992332 RepID=A0A9W7WND5_TRIRA|nr:hypothetical protein IRJ41_005537 [Triplophysa rosa]
MALLHTDIFGSLALGLDAGDGVYRPRINTVLPRNENLHGLINVVFAYTHEAGQVNHVHIEVDVSSPFYESNIEQILTVIRGVLRAFGCPELSERGGKEQLGVQGRGALVA